MVNRADNRDQGDEILIGQLVLCVALPGDGEFAFAEKTGAARKPLDKNSFGSGIRTLTNAKQCSIVVYMDNAHYLRVVE